MSAVEPQVLRCEITARPRVEGTVTAATDRPRYPGPYDVTPAADAQVLATEGLAMSSNVTVGGMAEAIEKAASDAMGRLVDGSFEGVYRNEKITRIRDYGLLGISNLTSLELPALTTIGNSGLCGCTNLTSLELPALTTIGNNVFMENSSLTTVELPAVTRVGGSTFQKCSALKRVAMPKLSQIGWAMCQGVESLEVFDTGARSFSSSAFAGCTSLVALIARSAGRASLGGVGEFANTPISNGTGYIYVPRALVDNYKVATNWSVYADQIRAIEDHPEICGPQ